MSLRDLPSVDRLARSFDGVLPRDVLLDISRSALVEARDRLRRGEPADPEARAAELVERLRVQRPRPVINATGVLLHTNLGRAPLHPEAAAAAGEAARGYGNLEIDLVSGERGRRGEYLERVLASITGAPAAFAVNNNAAALLLVLATLAAGRSVPVSRGELIEIGGSYRLPELMAASGAVLREVGTTNRTRVTDYERVLDEETALVLKVHPSNYRIAGFSEAASVADLARVCGERGIPLVFDAGSGLCDDRIPWLPGPPPSWLAGEPGVRQALEDGADLVLFSGDKLFGGPQAGIVVGRADLVAALRRHPLARALRLDGPTIAALAVTAELYASGRGAEIPLWRMARAGDQELRQRCDRVLSASGIAGEVVTGASTPGAGSVPGSELPTPVIAIAGDVDRRYLRLLRHEPPVVARREAGRLVVDLRAVPADLDTTLAEALSGACRS